MFTADISRSDVLSRRVRDWNTDTTLFLISIMVSITNMHFYTHYTSSASFPPRPTPKHGGSASLGLQNCSRCRRYDPRVRSSRQDLQLNPGTLSLLAGVLTHVFTTQRWIGSAVRVRLSLISFTSIMGTGFTGVNWDWVFLETHSVSGSRRRFATRELQPKQDEVMHFFKVCYGRLNINTIITQTIT